MADITKNDLFRFVGTKERRYNDLIWFANCETKTRDPSRPFISKNTFLKYKKELETEGKLKKRLDENGHIVYYVPEDQYSELEALDQWSQLQSELDVLTPEEIKNVLRDFKRLSREKRIKELEETPLPANAVYEKLKDFGFTSDDYFPYINEGIILNVATGPIFDKFTADDVEIELIPEEKYTSGNIIRALKFSPWTLLSTKPINGYFIRGIYKELLRLYDKKFEDDVLFWYENYDQNSHE